MANKLNLNLDEWKAQLTAEPAELGTAAAPVVQTAAQAAATALQTAYPTGPTGNLKAGVRVLQEQTADPAVTTSIVQSSAPHAHLYEYGTRYARAHPTFYPITDQYGAVGEQAITGLVASRGYTVTGTGGE